MSYHQFFKDPKSRAAECRGYCQQGRLPCACDPYAGEVAPRLVAWLDRHPNLAPVLMVAFILLVLGIGGWIDGGAL